MALGAMEYVVEEGIIWSIKVLYDGSLNSILLDSSVGMLFPSMDGVWQDCLMSLVLFNIYLEKIMCNSFQDHQNLCVYQRDATQ